MYRYTFCLLDYQDDYFNLHFPSIITTEGKTIKTENLTAPKINMAFPRVTSVS